MIESFSDLNYFIEAANSKNLSRASERLGITQPTLSRAVKKLEDVIGTELFFRSKKGVELTPAGVEIYQKSKNLLLSWDQIKTNALSITNEIQGNVTIGSHCSVAIHSLSHALTEALEQYPKLNIKLIHDLSRKINEDIISFRVDLGIVVNPTPHPDLILQKLGTDEVCFWRSQALTKNNDLNENPILICDELLIQTQDLKRKMKKSGLKFNRTISSTSLEVITQMVSCGAGIGIIPTRIVNALKGNSLVKIKKSPSYKDQFYISYRVENKSIASIKFLADHLKASFYTQ